MLLRGCFLFFTSFLFAFNSFGGDIFFFLDNFQNKKYQIVTTQKTKILTAIEKEVFYFYQAKSFFLLKDYQNSALSTRKLSQNLQKILQQNFIEEILAYPEKYTKTELITMIDLFPYFLKNILLLKFVKEKLAATYNQRIYKQLWLLGELKSIEIGKKNDFKNTNEEYLVHLKNLYKKREYTYLLKQYPKIKKRFQKDTQNYHTFLYQYSKLLKKTGRYQQALQNLQPTVLDKNNIILQFDLYLVLEENNRAHNFINHLKSKVSKQIINELRFRFARHHYLRREYQDSLKRYSKINWRYLSKKKKERALWNQLYSAIHYQSKISKIRDKIKNEKFNFQKYAASICYWEFKKKLKNTKLESCFPNYLLHYYGWQNVKNQKIDFLQLSKKYLPKKQNFLQNKDILLIEKIYQLQNKNFGDSLVINHIANLKTTETFQKATYLLQKYQRYPKLILLANSYYSFQQLKDSPFLTEWLRALFPLAYLKKIINFCKINNLEPALVLALIREESHFNPQAISSAGATGLMQLMPLTAKSVAKKKQISLKNNKIKDIAINLELGTFYLSWELKRFKQNIPYALAAYNGGGGNVKKWQKIAHKDFDYWLEYIPFLETKNYVKKVIRSYRIYQHLYKKEWQELANKDK